MNNIRILPPDIISRIAAGEVIERPASVLKELLENSLDAGADSIEVLLKGAGKTLIQVKDNGRGIAESDLSSIFNRHATSKISGLDDLYNISTLGFRGEALYSIAAISDVTLRSKTADGENGWEIHRRADRSAPAKPAASRTGTEIIVQELFFNTPARKKFLKSHSSELNHCLDVFIPYTLMHPDKKFLLASENKELINLDPVNDLAERVARSLHLDKKDLLEGSREFPEEQLTIRLVLGDINIQRTRKDMQFIFINGRPVIERAVSFHLNEIYRSLFPPGIYPFFCVYLTLPAAELDVNVHPAKREVRIRDEFRLLGLLRQFTEQLLMTKSKPRQAPEQALFNTGRVREPAAGDYGPLGRKNNEAGEQQASLSYNENILLFKTDDIFARKRSDLKEKLQQARYLGNLLKKYLLFETSDSLLAIDQHAAQERITFEKLKAQIEKGALEVQPLLSPVLLKLSAQERVAWDENKELLEKTGFSTSLFDEQTLAVHSHPQLITCPETSVRNLLAGDNIARLDPDKLARMACRSSVMAGFAMNGAQAEFQRKALLECADPFTCPHGRPTVVEILEETLQKQFLRK